MKLFRVGLALVYGLYCSQALALDKVSDKAAEKDPAPISVVESAKKAKLNEMSGKSVRQLLANVTELIPASDKPSLNAAMKAHPDFKMPKVEVIELNKQNGFAGIRVLVQLKSDSISMEFRDDPAKPMVINGVVFSHDDIQSADAILAKVAKDVKFKETFDSMNSVSSNAAILHFFAMVFTQAMPEANAQQASNCKEGMGRICWDGMTTQDQMKDMISRMTKTGVLNKADLDLYARQSDSIAQDACKTEGNPNCERLKQESKVLHEADDTATAESNARASTTASRKAQDGSSNRFWSSSNPAAWITGAIAIGALFVIIKSFRKKSSKASVNSGVTVDPFTPINTGTSNAQ